MLANSVWSDRNKLGSNNIIEISKWLRKTQIQQMVELLELQKNKYKTSWTTKTSCVALQNHIENDHSHTSWKPPPQNQHLLPFPSYPVAHTKAGAKRLSGLWATSSRGAFSIFDFPISVLIFCLFVCFLFCFHLALALCY